MKQDLLPQQVMAGRANQAQLKETSPVLASEDGATDVVSTRSLDKPAPGRMAGSGMQGDFVRKYFNDPNFQMQTQNWLNKFYTGSEQGLQQAQVKMQMGVPLIS